MHVLSFLECRNGVLLHIDLLNLRNIEAET